ncbi:MAG TPA: hypothetical protein VEL31_29865 [Ktedonobacteraceae bacterium]|nr:hypothetical protein [Ktedonobacteraceae bacterium]
MVSACAQDQASASAGLWLIIPPSVKKLAVLMTMHAAGDWWQKGMTSVSLVVLEQFLELAVEEARGGMEVD